MRCENSSKKTLSLVKLGRKREHDENMEDLVPDWKSQVVKRKRRFETHRKRWEKNNGRNRR